MERDSRQSSPLGPSSKPWGALESPLKPLTDPVPAPDPVPDFARDPRSRSPDLHQSPPPQPGPAEPPLGDSFAPRMRWSRNGGQRGPPASPPHPASPETPRAPALQCASADSAARPDALFFNFNHCKTNEGVRFRVEPGRWPYGRSEIRNRFDRHDRSPLERGPAVRKKSCISNT